jgi:hypothetical protein
MKVMIAASVALGMLGPALAEPLSVPKPPGSGGACPYGYYFSGSFCVPFRGAQDVIAKPPYGCPFGWTSSGSFCVQSVTTRPSCPPGWITSGSLCLRSVRHYR